MRREMLPICLCILIFSAPLFSEGTGIGYKEFILGQTKGDVKNAIKGKYDKVKYSNNGDMSIKTGEMANTRLFFDHKDKLFLIQVEIKWGEIAKVKGRLIEKFGQPNDYNGEEFNRSTGSYLMVRWFIDKKYKITAWETEDCRHSKANPCVIYVEYLDIMLKEGKVKFEQKKKEDAQRKKEGKTYDGF